MSDILTVLEPILILKFTNMDFDRSSSFPMDPKHDFIL